MAYCGRFRNGDNTLQKHAFSEDCQKQELQRRFRGLSCMHTIFPPLNSLPTVGKPDLVLLFSKMCRDLGVGESRHPNSLPISLSPSLLLKRGLSQRYWNSPLLWFWGPLPSNCVAQVFNMKHPYSTSQVCPVSWPISQEASGLPPQQLPQTTQS